MNGAAAVPPKRIMKPTSSNRPMIGAIHHFLPWWKKYIMSVSTDGFDRGRESSSKRFMNVPQNVTQDWYQYRFGSVVCSRSIQWDLASGFNRRASASRLIKRNNTAIGVSTR